MRILKLKHCCFVLLTIAMVSLTSGLTAAQEATLFDQFIGDWGGKGKLMNADAEFRMTWEWVLERNFVRLTFQNKMRGSDGTERMLKAQAFYKPQPSGDLTGTWFDSRGMVLPLKARVEHDTLTTLWGSPETEQGRTEYRKLNEGRIEVKDFVLKNGEWRQFGHAIYKRVGDD